MNERQHESEINDDRDGLGPRCFGPTAIGSVDQVNGEASEPCPGYVPTRHELLELARYWANQVLFIQTTFFHEAQIGSDDWRISEYGVRRLNRITELLGREAVRAVVSEVEREFQRQMGDDDWADFTGTAEDIDAHVETMFAEKSQNTARGPGDGQ